MDVGQNDRDWVEGLAMAFEWQWLLLALAPHHIEREREREIVQFLVDGFWVSVVWFGGLVDPVGGVVFHGS